AGAQPLQGVGRQLTSALRTHLDLGHGTAPWHAPTPLRSKSKQRLQASGRFSGGEGGEQVLNLFLDVTGIVNRARDLLAEQLPVTLAQTVDRHLDRPLAQPEFDAQWAIGDGTPVSCQRELQPLEQQALAPRRVA